LFAGTMSMLAVSAWSDVNVTESRYDLYRTGANPQETILNTSNVNVKSFGLLYSYPVDGDVYAQPLYVSNLKIPGKGTRNVVYVATMNDVVYAFDADSADGPDGGLLWTRDFRNPAAGVIPVPVVDRAANRNIRRNMGIESTPIIDTATQTLFLVARTQEKEAYVQRLHALNLATGREKAGSPVVIAGTYQGNTFNPKFQHQRAGLALAAGQVIICWAADAIENSYPYYGWIMAYDAKSLTQTGTFTTTTTVHGGGIWASGRAPAVIDNPVGGQDIVVFTGNAVNTKEGYDGVGNFPESVLRLRIDPDNAGNAISLVDWFTPDNWKALDQMDLDLGGSGPVILPGSGYIVGGGKQGIMYVIDPDDMGKMQKGNPKLIQSFRAVPVLHIMGGGVVWDRSSVGQSLMFYNWGESDRLRAYAFDGHKFDVKNVKIGKEYIGGHPGGILTLSSNGATPGTGIVWSWGSNKDSVIRAVKQGILRAYDAENISRLLWDSRMDAADDALAFAKFTPPTVANGKVYVATFSDKLLVYGLLPEARKQRVYVSLHSRIGDKPLEVTGASRMPGTRLQISTAKGTARQRWEVEELPNGDRLFSSALGGLFLDDALAGSRNGIPAQVWTKRPEQESAAQAWRVVPSTGGYVKIVSRDNDRALTLSNATGADGTVVRTRRRNGTAIQDWKIMVHNNAGVTECNTSAMQFVSALPRNRLLTAAPGNGVWIEDPDGSEAQTWRLQVRPKGGYEFHSVESDLVLTAIKRSGGGEVPVRLSAGNETAGQVWKPRWIEDPLETFSYVTAFGGSALAVKGGSADNETPAVTFPANESVRQKWRVQDSDSIWCLE
jgi:hypothetical protein